MSEIEDDKAVEQTAETLSNVLAEAEERQKRRNAKKTADVFSKPFLTDFNRPIRKREVIFQTWHVSRQVKHFNAVNLYIHYIFHLRSITTKSDILIILEKCENGVEELITNFEKEITTEISSLKRMMEDNGCDGLVPFSNPTVSVLETSTPIAVNLIKKLEQVDILFQMAETLYQDGVWNNDQRLQRFNTYNRWIRRLYSTIASMARSALNARYPKDSKE